MQKMWAQVSTFMSRCYKLHGKSANVLLVASQKYSERDGVFCPDTKTMSKTRGSAQQMFPSDFFDVDMYRK